MVNPDYVAVIGYAGRFPGARDVNEFWCNLEGSVESLTTLTDADLNEAGVPQSVRTRPNFVRAAQVLDGVEEFDAEFFSISPGEAEMLDPQQRIFLECGWAAFEHAGYVPSQHPGHVGVFAGVGMSTYLLNNVLHSCDKDDLALVYQAKLGNDKDFLATRMSYKFGLTGPSVVVQSACSTSLLAVHLAAQSLLDGECDAALAGGVSLLLPQRAGYQFQPGMILSPDGHCRPFDANARGTVRGNGVGSVLLKRLSDALADGDTVHGVIKGSAVNNDGSDKLGYTAPHEVAQREVVLQAQAVAGVAASSITYVEAHGTGTELGDPIEMAALSAAFCADTEERGYCAVGSVKSNIGHLDTAAGVAGLIKVLLMMRHGRIPATLHFSTPNPKIDFENSPFYVNTESRTWPRDRGPLRAGVSSTGIGGTNVHVVVEEPPRPEPEESTRKQQLLVLSARSLDALDEATDHLTTHLNDSPNLDLADIAYTLQEGREAHAFRRAIVGGVPVHTGQVVRTDHSVAFLFPGQGAQRAHMGRSLLAEPAFRLAADECAELFRMHLGEDLHTLIEGDEERLRQTAYAQPTLFTIEYAMAKLWMSWGIEPAAMLGHSIGEYVAACLAGVFSIEDVTWLVAQRGRLMQSMPSGAMLAVALPEAELATRLPAGIDLAAVNAESNCVVSGPAMLVEELHQRLTSETVGCWELRTSHAFHSASMDPVLAEFTQHVARARPQTPRIPFASNVTGDWITREQATDPAYWAQQLRSPVRFHDGARTLLGGGATVLLECGPGHALTNAVRKHPARKSEVVAATMARSGDEDLAATLTALGVLWSSGVEVDWRAHHVGERRMRVPLPSYPFQRQRFWLSPEQRDTMPHQAGGTFLPSWRRSAPLGVTQGIPATWRVLGEHDLVREIEAGLTALGHQLVESDADNIVDLTGLGGTPAFDAVRERLHGARYWLVADGLNRVESGDRVVPEKSPLLGLLAVAQQEIAGLRCHVIDVAGADAAAVLAEITGPEPPPVVALRGGFRMLPEFEPLVANGAGPGIRHGGVYLITGGLGRIGAQLTRHLRQEWGATVVLTSRRGDSESDGAHVLRADVAVEADMRAAVEHCEQRFGALHGVFHAAGLAGARAVRTIGQTNVEFLAEQFQAKVTGTQVLRRVLAGRQVDFCVLMSSTAAVFGGPGLAAYAAANNYLDATAEQTMAESGTRWLSVNWDRWKEAEGNSSDGEFAITPDEAVAALEGLLASPVRGRAMVSASSPKARWEKWRVSQAAAPAPSGLETAPQGELEDVVAEVWRRVLGLERVGLDDNFFELGGDSLIGLRVTAELERLLDVEIPAVRLFEGPTVRAMCRLLGDKRDDALDELKAEAERGRRRVKLLRKGIKWGERHE